MKKAINILLAFLIIGVSSFFIYTNLINVSDKEKILQAKIEEQEKEISILKQEIKDNKDSSEVTTVKEVKDSNDDKLLREELYKKSGKIDWSKLIYRSILIFLVAVIVMGTLIVLFG